MKINIFKKIFYKTFIEFEKKSNQLNIDLYNKKINVGLDWMGSFVYLHKENIQLINYFIETLNEKDLDNYLNNRDGNIMFPLLFTIINNRFNISTKTIDKLLDKFDFTTKSVNGEQLGNYFCRVSSQILNKEQIIKIIDNYDIEQEFKEKTHLNGLWMFFDNLKFYKNNFYITENHHHIEIIDKLTNNNYFIEHLINALKRDNDNCFNCHKKENENLYSPIEGHGYVNNLIKLEKETVILLENKILKNIDEENIFKHLNDLLNLRGMFSPNFTKKLVLKYFEYNLNNNENMLTKFSISEDNVNLINSIYEKEILEQKLNYKNKLNEEVKSKKYKI